MPQNSQQRLQASLPVAFLVFCASATAQQDTTQRPQPLFDGKSLDGWVQRGGKAEYRVEEGQIVGRTVPNTPNSFLCTGKMYTNFLLEYEFKVDPKLNSGVQIRSNSLAAYKNGQVHGYQVEIDPSERAWTAGVYDEGRRGWLNDLKDNEAARKAFRQDEWNKVRVEAVGPHIRTWLNGIAAANLTDELTRTGFIGLQVHNTNSEEPLEVRWRNLKIRDLGDPWRTPPKGAEVLLNEDAGDLAKWQHAAKPGSDVKWKFADGVLTVEPKTGDICTRKTYGDARIHVEFCVDENGKTGQENGNSGVYIQHRYEVQILNSAGQEPADNICGGIYKVKAADENMARPAGEWQTYDIWFTAPRWSAAGEKTSPARITVYHNGTRIHDNVEIPNKTGGGVDESPADGPLLLQDHGNRIQFRNIWIAPLEEKSEG